MQINFSFDKLPDGSRKVELDSWPENLYLPGQVERIGEKVTSVMTKEEFKQFLAAHKLTMLGLKKMPLSALLISLKDQFVSGLRDGTSLFGERVTVRTVSEEIVPTENGECDWKGEYVLIGDSGAEYDGTTISCKGVKGNVPALYRSLLGLAYSGCHATDDDKREAFRVAGKKIPDELSDS